MGCESDLDRPLLVGSKAGGYASFVCLVPLTPPTDKTNCVGAIE